MRGRGTREALTGSFYQGLRPYRLTAHGGMGRTSIQFYARGPEEAGQVALGQLARYGFGSSMAIDQIEDVRESRVVWKANTAGHLQRVTSSGSDTCEGCSEA